MRYFKTASLLLLSSMLSCTLFAKNTVTAPTAITVSINPVSIQTVPVYIEALGNLTSEKSVSISSEVDGRIQQIYFSDGQTVGKLDGLDIAANGLVSANYTNGLNIALGRLVMVNFNNQNGLKQIGNATYVETSVSGVAAVGEAGADGYGTILSGSLERSNVDITEELVNLITAQRNFQANAKTIETNTSLTQAIIQIRT